MDQARCSAVIVGTFYHSFSILARTDGYCAGLLALHRIPSFSSIIAGARLSYLVRYIPHNGDTDDADEHRFNAFDLICGHLCSSVSNNSVRLRFNLAV